MTITTAGTLVPVEDLAAALGDPALRLVDARAVLVFDESHGADVVLAHPSVARLSQLSR